MGEIQKVVTYQTTDGASFDDIVLAKEHQRFLGQRKRLKPWVSKRLNIKHITCVEAKIIDVFIKHGHEIVYILEENKP